MATKTGSSVTSMQTSQFSHRSQNRAGRFLPPHDHTASSGSLESKVYRTNWPQTSTVINSDDLKLKVQELGLILDSRIFPNSDLIKLGGMGFMHSIARRVLGNLLAIFIFCVHGTTRQTEK